MNVIALILITAMISSSILYDFKSKDQISDWKVVDDVVMGGESSGKFTINEQGNGLFSGHVSLENNGGFSSVRTNLTPTSVKGNEHFIIRLKGDGKEYQFRVKSNRSEYFSYVHTFKTSGKWQEVEVPFNAMYPSFRGRKLDLANFSGNQVEEMTFLIGNKKNENFQLEIDWIKIQ